VEAPASDEDDTVRQAPLGMAFGHVRWRLAENRCGSGGIREPLMGYDKRLPTRSETNQRPWRLVIARFRCW
jgi:hypothetical protein